MQQKKQKELLWGQCLILINAILKLPHRLLLWAAGSSTGPSDIKVWSTNGSNVTAVVSGIMNMVDMHGLLTSLLPDFSIGSPELPKRRFNGQI